MSFLIIAGFITLIVIILTVLPVFVNSHTPVLALDYDKEIYKARLKEIENERALGKISKKEYEYTLAEEGRRFIALANQSQPHSTGSGVFGGSGRKSAIAGAILSSLIISAIAFFGYAEWGSLSTPDQPLVARMNADPKGQSIQLLLKRAENQLEKDPSDGRGWLVVAPVYMRLNRPKEAVNAFKNAIRILGPTPDLQTQLGEAIAVSASGVVTEDARQLFEKAAIGDPASIKPRFFLAIALNQSGEYDRAASAWDDLIKKSPQGAPWLEVATQQLKLARSRLAPNLAPDAPGNPTAEDIKAAQQLSVSERQEFINSMVDRLAGELEDNPQNKPGWQRIIRSLSVLGRKDEAIEAIDTAMQVFKDDADFLKELAKSKLSLK